MFVRLSATAAFAVALVAISVAQAKRTPDLEWRNPENRQTYGFYNCEWMNPPRIKEVAGAGGRRYEIRNGKARCLPEGARDELFSSWTQIENVRCSNPTREATANVVACLRQHQGRLQVREGYFEFVHPEDSQGTSSSAPSSSGSRRPGARPSSSSPSGGS